MALDSWVWYLNEGKVDDLYYKINTVDNLHILYTYINKKKNGFKYKYLRNKTGAFLKEIITDDKYHLNRVIFKYQLGNDSDRILTFTFSIENKNEIHVSYWFQDESIVFYNRSFTYKDLFKHMCGLSNYVYKYEGKLRQLIWDYFESQGIIPHDVK